MPESSLNENADPEQTKDDIFSQLQVPPHKPFFVRLDGRRFQIVAEKLRTTKPFDKKFADCLVASGKAIFQAGFNPALIYIASDEINTFFTYTAPFNRRVEKINSVLSGTVSSTFSLNVLKVFNKDLTVAFDSRIIITSRGKAFQYVTWRQRDLWRNHNNAYAYWMLRKTGRKPSEAAKKLKGLKAKELHDFLFKHGVNLAKTPSWQRRGILIHKQPYQKQLETTTVTRWRIEENWNLPLFITAEGKALLQQILEWTKPNKK
jgi:tRNA(His) 5'-end guanylyltransferase